MLQRNLRLIQQGQNIIIKDPKTKKNISVTPQNAQVIMKTPILINEKRHNTQYLLQKEKSINAIYDHIQGYRGLNPMELQQYQKDVENRYDDLIQKKEKLPQKQIDILHKIEMLRKRKDIPEKMKRKYENLYRYQLMNSEYGRVQRRYKPISRQRRSTFFQSYNNITPTVSKLNQFREYNTTQGKKNTQYDQLSNVLKEFLMQNFDPMGKQLKQDVNKSISAQQQQLNQYRQQQGLMQVPLLRQAGDEKSLQQKLLEQKEQQLLQQQSLQLQKNYFDLINKQVSQDIDIGKNKDEKMRKFIRLVLQEQQQHQQQIQQQRQQQHQFQQQHQQQNINVNIQSGSEQNLSDQQQRLVQQLSRKELQRKNRMKKFQDVVGDFSQQRKQLNRPLERQDPQYQFLEDKYGVGDAQQIPRENIVEQIRLESQQYLHDDFPDQEINNQMKMLEFKPQEELALSHQHINVHQQLLTGSEEEKFQQPQQQFPMLMPPQQFSGYQSEKESGKETEQEQPMLLPPNQYPLSQYERRKQRQQQRYEEAMKWNEEYDKKMNALKMLFYKKHLKGNNRNTQSQYQDGLFNQEIDETLRDHMNEQQQQYFLGVFPRDSQELENILYQIKDDDMPCVFWIQNTNNIKDSSSNHWYAVFIDFDESTYNIFDSSGQGRQDQYINNNTKKYSNILQTPLTLKLKINDNQIQDWKDNNCGFFSMDFIMRMLDSQGNFQYSSYYNLNQNNVKPILKQKFGII